eukprot:TRINITY_DN10895_c0_g1_i2.p2 TRINITY_DN10895_c0_g1~~TRINITY_DN10895_c0_g1_i2.p2  ORF type:complete len:131 (+),score=12.75 TRINITY_DN10895_c0_g1_i2:1790-2182(+)
MNGKDPSVRPRSLNTFDCCNGCEPGRHARHAALIRDLCLSLNKFVYGGLSNTFYLINPYLDDIYGKDFDCRSLSPAHHQRRTSPENASFASRSGPRDWKRNNLSLNFVHQLGGKEREGGGKTAINELFEA